MSNNDSKQDDFEDELLEDIEQIKFDLDKEVKVRETNVKDIYIEMSKIKETKILVDQDKELLSEMDVLEEDINTVIGFSWWKRYVAGAFWSNIATPLNFSLSILTLITTGEAMTRNLLSEGIYSSLSLAALFVSLVNSFFAPHRRMTENVHTMNDWRAFGNRFEAIYYSSNRTPEDRERRIQAYRALLIEIKEYTKDMPDQQNFLTDCLHVLVRVCCFGNQDKWIELRRKYHTETKPSKK
jgi:hypothetical protein